MLTEMDDQLHDDLELKLSLQPSRTRSQTRNGHNQSRSSSIEPMSVQLDDNTEPATLRGHSQLKQPDTNDSYTKQRMADLEAEYDKVKEAMFKMSVDLISIEKLAEDRAHEIVELELEANRHSCFITSNPSVYCVLQELAVVKKERDALRRELDVQHVAAEVDLSECATMGEALGDSLFGDPLHQKEVAELKRLVNFYKQNSERTCRQLQELQLQLRSQQSIKDNEVASDDK
ncbi:hypothetical protein MN608_11175 [Microdochium nivale]|nr:hypothetical protein MN608_11175 [Microdochium nivale]